MLFRYNSAMKKIRLTTYDLFENDEHPEQSWMVPQFTASNSNFIEVLKDTITFEITDEKYRAPLSFEELFSYLRSSRYAIFEERYVVCFMQGKLAYLNYSGFHKMSAMEPVFDLNNWKIVY